MEKNIYTLTKKKRNMPFLIAAYLVLSPLLLYSQQKVNQKLIIEGSVKDVKDSIPYIYARILGGKTDTAKVINGNYRFEIEANTTLHITLLSKDPRYPQAYSNRNLLIFISEPSVIHIVATDSFCNATISGSKAYKEYTKLEDKAAPYRKQLSALFRKRSEQKLQNNQNELIKTEKNIDSIRYAMMLQYLQYAKDNFSSYITTYALSQFSSYMKEDDVPQVAELLNRLTENEQSSYFGKSIIQNLKRFDIKTGNEAPLFTMNNPIGASIALKSFRGKYVLLDFWASWCAPCRAENALLVKIFEKYRNKQFDIISISLDDEQDNWIKAIRKDKMQWINLCDLRCWNNLAAQLYKVSRLPRNFLIDPIGKIIARDVYGAELDELIGYYLK